MKKPTKNIITRQQIHSKLQKEYTQGVKDIITLCVFLIAVILFWAFFMLLGAASTREILFTALAFTFPVLLLISPIVIIINERKKLSRGEFVIEKMALSYKTEYARTTVNRRVRLEEVLIFRDFKAFAVEHTAYELATNGDEYYVVYFKNSKTIRQIYPTKAYELKE